MLSHIILALSSCILHIAFCIAVQKLLITTPSCSSEGGPLAVFSGWFRLGKICRGRLRVFAVYVAQWNQIWQQTTRYPFKIAGESLISRCSSRETHKRVTSNLLVAHAIIVKLIKAFVLSVDGTCILARSTWPSHQIESYSRGPQFHLFVSLASLTRAGSPCTLPWIWRLCELGWSFAAKKISCLRTSMISAGCSIFFLEGFSCLTLELQHYSHSLSNRQ